MTSSRTRMTLCLVTSGARLCPDAASPARRRDALVQQARWAVEAGIDMIQVREPDLSSGDLAALVRLLVALSRGRAARIVVNDRVDVAVACGADGVHLRGDSIPADQIRRIVPRGFIIGRSVHAVDEARRAGAVDYLIAGTVFESDSKPGRAGAVLLGTDGLAGIVRAVQVPVLAIGGVTLDRVPAIAAAQAAGIAAIGLFLGPPASGPAGRAVPLTVIVNGIRARFDTPGRAF